MDFGQYLQREIECACGRKHRIDCKYIFIEDGALARLPDVIAEGGFRRLLLIADENTHAAIDRISDESGSDTFDGSDGINDGSISAILQKSGFIQLANTVVSGDGYPNCLDDSEEAMSPHGESVSCEEINNGRYFYSVTLSSKTLLPDEEGIGGIVTAMLPGCDVIVAIGSGTLNDMCRFVSYKLGIPYIIVATAPSMDGYTSHVCAMITNRVKTTYYTHVPFAVIGDLGVLAAAPKELIAAGVGDVLGKYISLVEWQIAHLITDEYYCPFVASIVREALEKTRAAVSRLGKEDSSPTAITVLMEALVLSGMAMTMADTSRPASGSEHHLAHYWEMQALLTGAPAALHGAKVGVATLIILHLYQQVAAGEINLTQTRHRRFDEATYIQEIKVAYGSAAEAVIALERESQKNSDTAVTARIDCLKEHHDEIMTLISALPTADEISALLTAVGASLTISDINVSDELLTDSLRYAKEQRVRYGLLQMLYDCGWGKIEKV
ncbi:MAG: sn-glycerol-1-phosphate dehydrogenase [Lachnospiraceae bacterium]|jgi:glycerol-1-phosphate dehydrogenase [NAD(P)+]|nr:sn-glycerol-1-phosphate dehydrogenase [Lachnospiraceae bacterium]